MNKQTKDTSIAYKEGYEDGQSQTAISIRKWLIKNEIFDWEYKKQFDRRFKVK